MGRKLSKAEQKRQAELAEVGRDEEYADWDVGHALEAALLDYRPSRCERRGYWHGPAALSAGLSRGGERDHGG